MFPLCIKCFVYIQYDIHLTLVSMSLHRPSGNVVNRVNNNKYHPSTDAPQELDKGWYTHHDIPQLNGTGSTSLSYKPHPNKGGANDKSLPLDEAPPQEPAKKKARTSFAIPSSQVTDLSTDVEVQPPPMKEKKSDDVAGAALTTLLDRQEFVDVLAQIDPERRKIHDQMASRLLYAFCSCHINTRPNTYTPIPSDVKTVQIGSDGWSVGSRVYRTTFARSSRRNQGRSWR